MMSFASALFQNLSGRKALRGPETVALDRYGHLFPALDEVLDQRLEATYGDLLAPRGHI